MFSFFRRKKKKEETAQASPVQPSASNQQPTVNPHAGALEAHYNTLLQKYSDSPDALDQAATVYTLKNNYEDKNKWIEALAICQVSLNTNTVDDTIVELYRQIYSNNWNKYVSMDYNEVDYTFWFDTNRTINQLFINAGITRGYCEQADLYGSARRGYQDLALKAKYIRQGVEANDPASIGDYGYNIYVGIAEYGEANKEEGRKQVKKALDLGYESAELLLLYMDFYDDVNNPELLEKITNYIDKTQPAYRKPYHLLADYYLRQNTNLDQTVDDNMSQLREDMKLQKATEAMQQGVQQDVHYCKYLLGMNQLNERIPNADKNQAIKLLEEAYQHYVIYAANLLGQYYAYTNDENKSLDKAIHWHQKAAQYCFGESSFELACIYLYNDAYKDIPKGLQYLEQSITDGSHRAISEKAYLMLETETLPKDMELAKTLLEKANDMGNEYAPYRLALGYQNAEWGGESDYVKALQLFEVGAERNHLYSIELAGNYYRVGVAGDTAEAGLKAVEYLSQARNRGSNYARVELGMCYELGIGVEKDYQQAFDLYHEAADNDYPYANSKLAAYYEDALVGEENLSEAFNQYTLAANAGIPYAIYNLGRYYKYAVGIPENPTEAMRLFGQAAEMDNAPALVEIALAYELEYAGTEFDAVKASEYMTRAAEMGYTYAQYKLGSYYYYGLIDTDIPKAIHWYTKAYEEGGHPYAATALGDIYLYNATEENEPDYSKAFPYYQYAEEQGVVSEGIGVCYDYGIGVEESETEALKYYTLAANDNWHGAKYRLGLAYKHGRGTTVNLVEAYRWLSDAAQNGNYNAQYETAMMLINGEGVAQEQEQGAKMLLAIAEQDHNSAQFELGNCYLSGRGVTEDEVQAMYWYQKAADNGNEQAQKITGKRDRRKK
ncbi:MAG: hypothetical protein RL662_1453 [Bacteroidota bacterium]|jgi:TPR repeat protein